jgi:hypothetical protein
MTIRAHTYWLLLLFVLMRLSTVNAQTTLNLYYGDPAASPDEAFDGNVFQVGSQIGDAAIYAKFGGTGTKSFQIDSPGENKTITVDKDGFFFIRPVSSMVVDQSRIKNFTGTVTGSVSINVKPLIITTLSANVANNVAPGSEITVSYMTGAGTFPVDLVLNSFGVQLLNVNGNLVATLQNTVDQYSGREKQGASFGGTRYIKATIPANTAPGTYQVRVVTRGLLNNVSGSPSTSFTVRADTPPSLTATSLGNVYCAGSTVPFPFSTTGTFAANEQFRIQRVDASGNTLEELTGLATASPVRAVLPATLPAGTYRFRVFASVANVVSNIINVSVAALPTMTISGNSATTTGGKATIQLVLTGTPPWSFSYTDYNPIYAPTYLVSATSSSSTTLINPTFVTSTFYDKSLIKGFRDSGCGTSEFITGSAQISINQTTITTGTLAGTYCPGSSLSVPFTVSSPLPADVVYQAQLSDANGTFSNGAVIGSGVGTGPISTTIPPTVGTGTGYRIRVVATSSTVNYSNSVTSTSSSLTLSRPDAPRVSDVSFCTGTSTAPLTAAGVNLIWYSAGSTQPLAGAPTPPNNQSSVYTVSQTINGCQSNLATVNVIAKPLPAAPAVSSIALCQGSQGQFTSTIANALWYTASTGGTGSPQPPALNSQAVGDQIVYVTQTVDGCESPRAAVKATVNPIPAAPVPQTPAPVCQYATASPLTASGQSLTWYGQSGAIGATATPETRVAGTFSYSVSQRVSGCESPQAVVSIIIRQAPSVPVASSPSYCVGESPRSLTATGTNIKWYTTELGGTSTATIATFPTDRPALLSYYVTQTDNFSCESQRLLVLVTVLAAPSAPSVTATQTVCQFSKASPLTASPTTGLLWQGPGIAGSTDTAPTPNTSRAGTYTYVVTQKVGSCTSPASQITYTVRQQPEQPKVSDNIAFCIGNASVPLTATATGRLTWYKTAEHSDGGLAQIIPNTSSANTTIYYVTQTDNFNCESANDTVVVRVSAKSTARLSGDEYIYKGERTAIRVRFTGDGPWTFTDWDGVTRTINDSLYVGWQEPTATRVFRITNLNSSCGVGDIMNSYTLTVLVPLATQPTPEPLFLNAYPNPSTGELNVDWHSPKKQTVTLQLINADGKVIEQVVRQATTGSQTEHFQLNDQPTGTYILNVTTTNNGKLTRRIVKQ